ncbi:MAG TPA: DUF4268 domain-containing protein, partial [Myxococcota bacterium]|nr:DUF4268 domain-containing protein [Myxococcota bacterium]
LFEFRKLNLERFFITERLRKVPADKKSFEIQFSELEQWMNHPLPAVARRERSWWANDGGEISRAWLDAGFRVGELNVTEGRVTWQRLFGREAEYIRFFGEIIGEIRRQDSKAPLLDSPNGQSYHPFFYLRAWGPGAGTLRAAFDRMGELRVEIYLDTGDKTSTKVLFMEIMRHRRALESAAEASLVWEELPDNRASRVYLTVPQHGGENPQGSDNRVVRAAGLLLGLHAELRGILPGLTPRYA